MKDKRIEELKKGCGRPYFNPKSCTTGFCNKEHLCSRCSLRLYDYIEGRLFELKNNEPNWQKRFEKIQDLKTKLKDLGFSS